MDLLPTRYQLTEENAKKVEEISRALNISPSAVVNKILERLKAVELREVVTFTVEVRDSQKPDEPGATRRKRAGSNFAKSWQ
jgi:hypothetical protein